MSAGTKPLVGRCRVVTAPSLLCHVVNPLLSFNLQCREGFINVVEIAHASPRHQKRSDHFVLLGRRQSPHISKSGYAIGPDLAPIHRRLVIARYADFPAPVNINFSVGHLAHPNGKNPNTGGFNGAVRLRCLAGIALYAIDNSTDTKGSS